MCVLFLWRTYSGFKERAYALEFLLTQSGNDAGKVSRSNLADVIYVTRLYKGRRAMVITVEAIFGFHNEFEMK